jgi:hypothetical protein
MSEMEPIIKSIKIISQDGLGTEAVYAEQVGADIYKLLENPIFSCRINYGTTVKAIADENGELVLSKLVRASDYKTRQFLLSSSQKVSDVKDKILGEIEEAGGTWEVVMGGIVFVHIPKSSGFDLDQVFKECNYLPTEIVDDDESSLGKSPVAK